LGVYMEKVVREGKRPCTITGEDGEDGKDKLSQKGRVIGTTLKLFNSHST
jgi:hypothetical protein